MSEAAALPGQDTVVRVGGGVPGRGRTKSRTLLHTLENEINAILVGLFHASARRFKIIFLAHSLLSPLDRDLMVAGEGLHPTLIVVGPTREHFLGDRRHAHHLTEEIDDLFGTRQPRKIAVDDNSVETVINKHQQACKKACEKLHRLPPPLLVSTNKIIGEATDGVKISNIFG
jgi:hypothetical protein